MDLLCYRHLRESEDVPAVTVGLGMALCRPCVLAALDEAVLAKRVAEEEIDAAIAQTVAEAERDTADAFERLRRPERPGWRL